jgi:hypothetical protein
MQRYIYLCIPQLLSCASMCLNEAIMRRRCSSLAPSLSPPPFHCFSFSSVLSQTLKIRLAVLLKPGKSCRWCEQCVPLCELVSEVEWWFQLPLAASRPTLALPRLFPLLLIVVCITQSAYPILCCRVVDSAFCDGPRSQNPVLIHSAFLSLALLLLPDPSHD